MLVEQEDHLEEEQEVQKHNLIVWGSVQQQEDLLVNQDIYNLQHLHNHLQFVSKFLDNNLILVVDQQECLQAILKKR